MYSVVNLYSDDIIVDVITIRGNQNFHLCLFVKVWVITVEVSNHDTSLQTFMTLGYTIELYTL
jgi:hypothetical protein